MRHLKEGRQEKGRIPSTSKTGDKIGESISIRAELSLQHLYCSYSQGNIICVHFKIPDQLGFVS